MSIERKEVFTDEAIGSPLIMAENFDKLAASVEKLLVLLKQSGANIKAADTTAKLTKEVETLTLAQVEQEKITKQLAVAEARQNEEYQKTKQQINDLNKQTKVKNELGERDARTVNQQNASIKQLEVALNKNREAYKALTNEEQRNSKAGKELIKIIENQDKAVKKQNESLGKFQDSVGNYKKGFEGLNSVSGGVVSNLKGIGSSLLQIVSSPVTLGLALVAGAFVAMKTAADSYYNSSLEGEETLQRTKAARDAFFDSYKTTWNDFGKYVSLQIDMIQFEWMEFLKTFNSKEENERIKQLQSEAVQHEKFMSILRTKKLQDLIDDAETELEVNKLMEISRDKLGESADKRINALKKGNRLLAEQEQGDIDLLNEEIVLQQNLIEHQSEVNRGFYDRSKAIQDLSHEEIVAIRVNREETDKLGQLEAALFKLQSDASVKRTARLKLETTLTKEINEENQEAVRIAAQMARILSKEDESFRTQSLEDQATFHIMSRQQTIDDVSLKLEILKEYGLDVSKLQKNIATKMAADDKADKDATLAREKALQDALLQLRAQAFQTANDLVANHFEAEQIELDARKNRIETAQAEELTAAGNNANAKAAIEAKYAAQIKEIENEQRAVRRKQAIADKALAAFQIAINTAQAISKSVAASPLTLGLPWAAIAAAIGALQLAAVLTKPIPAFEKGVKPGVFGGGSAIVGERGVELINTNQGSYLSPSKASLVNLPKGAEVVPHKETMRRLAAAGIETERFNNRQVSQVIPVDAIVDEQRKSTKEITKAIYSGNAELYLQASVLMKKKKISDTYTKKMMAKHGL